MTAPASAPPLQAATDADQRPGGDSETGLAGVLNRIDRLLGRAVQSMSAGQSTAPAHDPFRGLYLSDADAARLVARGSAPVGGLVGERPIVDPEAAGPPWRRLAQAFALSPGEVDVVALALAAELDLRYERIFGYLHDDLTRRRLTPDLACQLLCRSLEERLAARRMFDPDAPLLRFRLVHLTPDPSQPAGPTIGHGIGLDDGLVEFLLGRDRLDRRLAGVARWEGAVPAPLAPELTALVDRLVRESEIARPDGPARHLVLSGPNEPAKREVARHFARKLGRPLLTVDLARLTQLDCPFTLGVLLTARVALLLDALTLWTHGELLMPAAHGTAAAADEGGAGRIEPWLEGLDTMGLSGVLLATTEPSPAWPVELTDRFVAVSFALPDADQRRTVWSGRLAHHGVAVGAEAATLLGEVFHLDADAIARAVEQATVRARWREDGQPEVGAADLFAAARAQIARALPRYATRVEPTHTWDDIVLPADQLDQLRELCTYVRHRHRVLNEWGFGRRLPLGKGVAALFAGPSGTGKTMAAQIIAGTLGLDLYRVEIPAVVSKYIGDTEKALDQLFREAQGTSVVLFFDEADALFGKRSEVRDAHDRYANIETSYLLQALEQYDGLTILATNLRHNVDDAFVRRLAFTVTFPVPEEAERRRIWRRCWPELVPLAEDVDVDFLARRFKLTGGNIRNVALAAAFAAAAADGPVTMAHVVRGVRREFQKMGKVCVETDFGPYFALLGAGRAAAPGAPA